MPESTIIQNVKKFNIEGPCDPKKHYLIPALIRQTDVKQRIEDERYFVLHAPRQSGKTTFLQAMLDEINGEGQYYALYCSLERLQNKSDIASCMYLVLDAVQEGLELSANNFLAGCRLESINSLPEAVVSRTLRSLCKALDKPLVIFFDEADCLIGDPLIAFLRDVRTGYINRNKAPFPRSIALIGMRNIRDYIAKVRPDYETLGTASPFNIASPLTITNFTRDEIGVLYGQHTEDTGQVFEPEAVDRAWYWTEGQPWLVNALAKQVVEVDLKNDFSIPVTANHIDAAADLLKRRRSTHIDSLANRLKEPRVIKVLQPVLIGAVFGADPMDDDCQFCLDLGLLKTDDSEKLRPANPIYSDVIVRTIALRFKTTLSDSLIGAYLDGKKADISAILKVFQDYWRLNADIIKVITDYPEAIPHLYLDLFLRKIGNGSMQITRESALGMGRVDIMVVYAGVRYPIEVKIFEPGPAKKQEAITQMSRYLDVSGAKEGWLIFFNRDPEKKWSDKIYWETETFPNDLTIHFVGC